MPDQFSPANVPPTESPESSPGANTPITVGDSEYTEDSFIPGEITSFDVSSEPFVAFDYPGGKEIVHQLVITASRTDVASRRFEVEQAWEARLFERGYQHLLPRRGGGWSLPGEGSKWGPLSTADSSALYATNIYGRDKDIIVAAIARETPQTQFFPLDANHAPDVVAAEAANKYKIIYEKNNDLRSRLAEVAYYYYTDDRAVLYTRQVADAQRYGINIDGTPRAKEITSVYGKLEAKVPVSVQDQREMHFIQIYNEIDVSTARARYPWAAKEIRPGSCGIGEIELDKISRVNTKLALLGSYVTGDAMMREVTEQFTWIRPEMYFDEIVPKEFREELLAKCPKGMLIVYAGQTFCFARNESMDDHLVVTHAMTGNGQNRRGLGTNNISVQKRANAYFDIMDDFFRRTVPRRIYDNDAFDMDALQQQDNTPGTSIPVQRQPGVPMAELVTVEPTPQPQPALPEFCKLFFEDVPASLSGALPSLFGASTNTDTVGGIAIQRDQALARIGLPWNAAKAAFMEACRQAVICASSRAFPISASLPSGNISIDPNVLKGNIVCYPEYDQSFPESWKERELRYTEMVVGAASNPFYGEMLREPSNLRAIADNIRMADLHIPGEDSAKKQLIEIDQLKRSAPIPNPTLLQGQQKLEQIKQGMQADLQSGVPIPPEASQMLQQAEKTLQDMPPEISSIPPAADTSENHNVEAQVCFNWLNSEEGIKFKHGTAEQQHAWQNIYLHWQAHMEMAQKFAPPPTVAQPPHITIPFDKMPPEAQTQALTHAGITASPASLSQAKLINTQHEIAKKVVPKTVPESINVHKLRRS